MRLRAGTESEQDARSGFYSQNMLLCAITERRLLGDTEEQRREALLAFVRKWARGGVDYIQIREKDLAPAELLSLARSIVAAVREEQAGRPLSTKILLNGPPEVALEAGADGVHLTGAAPPAAAVATQEIYARASRQAILSQSCHTADEAARSGASLLLYAPVYEKSLAGTEPVPGKGLLALAEACRAALAKPVLALGGITTSNAQACIHTGARGIAAIRLFQTEDWQNLRKPSL